MGKSMRWAEGFIAADWGTTNRRAYRIGPDGSCTAEFEDSLGMLAVPPGGFPAAVEDIRSRLGNLPLLLAGMVGSNRGWMEARYVPCPAGIDDLAKALVWPAEQAAIIPGVCYLDESRADVMRGEEVQVLGAVAGGTIPPDALVCHPGTHNKWVRVEGGQIVAFRTVMTGELFSLLKAHSILGDLLQGEAMPDEAFDRGVAHGLEKDDLTSELFQVRARVLLGRAPVADASSYVSGLLIGCDLRSGLPHDDGGPVHVMGRPELTRLYAAALRCAGRQPIELNGEQSFLAGIRAIAMRI